MARLRSELQRLYFPLPAESVTASATDVGGATHGLFSSLIDAQDMLRAMVLQIGEPANWESTSAVWQGVQRELGLPAPAIAVSGLDGFQLWFSLAQAVPVPQAQAFLKALQARFLADIPPRRIRLMPGTDLEAPQSLHHRAIVPALQTTGNWSAFVSSDLAPIFVETPWLDITPSDEGQADLLRGIRSIKPADWEAALEQLGLLAPPSPTGTNVSVDAVAGHQQTNEITANAIAANASQHARQFLLKVMNDETVALALRIESAKALLQYPDRRDKGQGA